MVAVGGDNGAGSPAVWSPLLPWVSATAPWVGVVGAYPVGTVDGTPFDTGAATWSGTSFAAAAASGAVAADMSTGDGTAHEALGRLLASRAGPLRPFGMAS